MRQQSLSQRAMRMLLVLLAMITGLSLPEVALAVSRAEVADSGIAAAPTVAAEQRTQRCICRSGNLPQKPATPRRRTLWLPAPAFAPSAHVYLSDRPLE